MLNTIEKNLTIASMELCLQDAHTLAGIETLATVERFVKQLRVMLTTNPATVSDAHIKLAWDMIAALETLPSRKNLSRLYRRISPTASTSTTPTTPTTTGQFDGSAMFDGSTTFGGNATGASGQFDGSTLFDGSKKFDGGTT
jgi:hypothetical protein